MEELEPELTEMQTRHESNMNEYEAILDQVSIIIVSYCNNMT